MDKIYNKAFNEWTKHWFQFILDNPDKSWDYNLLSCNPNITWDIVRDNPDKHWCYDCLSGNKMIKAKDKFITSYLQKWFSQSNLKRELIEKLWHPNNLERMQYNGFNIFDDLIIV
jgi:hypothetical protein